LGGIWSSGVFARAFGGTHCSNTDHSVDCPCPAAYARSDRHQVDRPNADDRAARPSPLEHLVPPFLQAGVGLRQIVLVLQDEGALNPRLEHHAGGERRLEGDVVDGGCIAHVLSEVGLRARIEQRVEPGVGLLLVARVLRRRHLGHVEHDALLGIGHLDRDAGVSRLYLPFHIALGVNASVCP
jgi:hypothetical protein